MSDIMNFNFGAKNITVAVDPRGNPWFLANEVCVELDLKNSRQAVSALDDDDKSSVHINDGTPGNPNKTVINEAGLYSLVFKSKKPQAKAFKRWVVHEVLPKIRKTGSYNSLTMDQAIDQIVAGMGPYGRQFAVKMLEQRASDKLTIDKLRPQAKALVRLAYTDDSLALTEAAKTSQVGPRKYTTFLQRIKWIYKTNTSRDWIPYQRIIDAGYMEKRIITIPQPHGDDITISQPRMTKKGLAKAAYLLEKEIADRTKALLPGPDLMPRLNLSPGAGNC